MSRAGAAVSPGTAAVRVELGPRSYEVQVGDGLIAEAGARMRPLLPQRRVVVVADEMTARLFLPGLAASLDSAGIANDAVVLPAGEQTKDFAHLERLVDQILDKKIERTVTLVALGGGVIGDITGFAASVLLRGLPFVQIPTTLLAQVDSSVGGKTGINTRQGKNLVGTFHQPRLVLADTAALERLPARQLRAGYAEVVKYGLIDNPAFFAWLEGNGRALLDGDRGARRHAVLTSCAAKAAIVAADETEAGRRALLNLGHTFGHAFEAETGYGEALLHGEAVAIGMALAFRLSARLGLCPPADAERVAAHLAAVGLPVALSGLAGPGWTAGRLLDHMQQDKKVKNGRLTFVLAGGVGKAFISHEVPIEAVRALLEEAIAEATA
jgi:3-dehydroquinate synthase